MECRRSVLLAHFGESFDVKRCHGTCDVCATRNGQDFEQVLIATTEKQPRGLPAVDCTQVGCLGGVCPA